MALWAADSSSVGICPYFFEDSDGDVQTVNSERYLHLPRRKFVPTTAKNYIDINDVSWYQQDGETPYTAVQVMNSVSGKVRVVGGNMR